MKYEILCCSLDELIAVCIKLLKDGICFTADTMKMKIILTGGF